MTSQQYTLCRGLSAKQVIANHEDFYNMKAENFTKPHFLIARQGNPRFVIALENSEAMNSKGQWHFVRTALRNLITEDLPDAAEVGLVMFNTAAHIAHPLVRLGHPEQSKARQSLSLQIKSKHNLFPSKQPEGCIICGIHKAIKTMQVSKSGSKGGVILIISTGGNKTLPPDQQGQMARLIAKHHVQLFSVSLETSLSLAQLAHTSSGQSWTMINQQEKDRPGPDLSVYLDILDTFRFIMAMTLTKPPSLVSQFTLHLILF